MLYCLRCLYTERDERWNFLPDLMLEAELGQELGQDRTTPYSIFNPQPYLQGSVIKLKAITMELLQMS